MPLLASGVHDVLGPFRASVEDLSVEGLGLAIEGGPPTSAVATGDRLRELVLSCGDTRVFEGTAHVRRVQVRGTELLLGVQWAGTLDLSHLYRLADERPFRERLVAALRPSPPGVSDAFRLWVSEQRDALERLRSFLDREERALAAVEPFRRREALMCYLETATPPVVARMNVASRELASLVAGLTEEEHGAHRRYYKAQLLPYLRQSPILDRAFAKPLGYAGDYEMMNMLYRDPAEGDSLFGKVMNVYAAQEPAARANINRLQYLGEAIRAVLTKNDRARVASIGCGPAREISRLLEESPELGPSLDVVLIDQEARVLEQCERTLIPMAAATGARVRVVGVSVRGLLSTRDLKAALGERDFIYSAGLFDYLSDRTFEALLVALYGATAPGGQLAVGNVARHNPTRHFMEYGLDWFLIHRSSTDLVALARGLTPSPLRVEVDAESTGVNLFLRVWR